MSLRRELWQALRAPLLLLGLACGLFLMQMLFDQLGQYGEAHDLFSLSYLVVFKVGAALGLAVLVMVVPLGCLLDEITRGACVVRSPSAPVRLRFARAGFLRTRSIAGLDRPPRT